MGRRLRVVRWALWGWVLGVLLLWLGWRCWCFEGGEMMGKKEGFGKGW